VGDAVLGDGAGINQLAFMGDALAVDANELEIEESAIRADDGLWHACSLASRLPLVPADTVRGIWWYVQYLSFLAVRPIPTQMDEHAPRAATRIDFNLWSGHTA